MLFKDNSYPIICAAMNGVSDVRLAISAKRAGIVPSLVVFQHIETPHNRHVTHSIASAIEALRDATGSSECILACTPSILEIQKIREQIISAGVTHVEVLAPTFLMNIDTLLQLKQAGIKLITKMSYVSEETILRTLDVFSIMDGIVLKNKRGAGLNFEHYSLEVDQVSLIRELLPHISIILSGGVGNKQDIFSMLNNGADYVSAGTIFAMSSESSLSYEVKQLILQKRDKLTRLYSSTLGFSDLPAFHNCIVLNENSLAMVDDDNHTSKLLAGLSGAKSGIIYVGEGISKVNNIYSIEKIIEQIT